MMMELIFVFYVCNVVNERQRQGIEEQNAEGLLALFLL